MDRDGHLWQSYFMSFNRNSSFYKTAAGAAKILGIRYFDSLYGEKNLLTDIPSVNSPLDHEIRLADKEEIRKIAGIQGGDTLFRFEFALETGSSCYIVWAGGKPAGYTWINTRVMMMDMMKVIDVPDGGSFHFNSVVFPEFRRNKLFQCMIYRVYKDMKDQGYKFTGNFVDRDNTASIKARNHFNVLFQTARIGRIPGFPLFSIGRKFVPGATMERF
jgi:hypothetical protein